MNIWYDIIIGAAALQGFLLAIIHYTFRNGKSSTKWLSILLFCISYSLVGRIFYDASLFSHYPKIAIASDGILFLYGPLLYWYLRTTLVEEKISIKKISSHFIISAFHIIWLTQFLFVNNTTLISLLQIEINEFIGKKSEIFAWFHIAFYLILSVNVYSKYLKKIKNNLSSLPTIYFINYFFFINFSALLIWSVSFIRQYYLLNFSPIFFTYNFIWIILTFSIYMISYFTIVYPQIFKINFTSSDNELKFFENSNLFVKENRYYDANVYKNNKTTDEEAINFINKLKQHMTSDKPFLDSNLTLPILAYNIDCSTHFLSKLINENLKKNFFDFVNEYRVNYFISLLKNPENKQFTLLSLAFESGFNSKSTFNVAFKKVTNKTPSALLNEIKNNNAYEYIN